jgi:hypothetical protein
MLVVPNHWGRSPLRGNGAFAGRLRGWADAGVEMFVHGWFHMDDSTHRGIAALKGRYMTASEGEFLGLSRSEAARRMEEGRELVQDIIGREVAGFVAPAWLYGPGAREALREGTFAVAEDHMKVWRPWNGETLARGPAITWASRSTARTISSLAFAAIAPTVLKPLKAVRVAVHPGDVGKQEILTSIGTTLEVFARQRMIGRYSDLLA